MTVWIEKGKGVNGVGEFHKDTLAFNVSGDVAFCEIRIDLYDVMVAMQNAGYSVQDRPPEKTA